MIPVEFVSEQLVEHGHAGLGSGRDFSLTRQLSQLCHFTSKLANHGNIELNTINIGKNIEYCLDKLTVLCTGNVTYSSYPIPFYSRLSVLLLKMMTTSGK